MDVKTIAVIGAGTMGRGIAYAAAFGGYKAVLEDLHTTLGEKYRPKELSRQYLKQGRLGRKTGRGVYEYPQQQAAERKG